MEGAEVWWQKWGVALDTLSLWRWPQHSTKIEWCNNHTPPGVGQTNGAVCTHSHHVWLFQSATWIYAMHTKPLSFVTKKGRRRRRKFVSVFSCSPVKQACFSLLLLSFLRERESSQISFISGDSFVCCYVKDLEIFQFGMNKWQPLQKWCYFRFWCTAVVFFLWFEFGVA